MPEEKRKMIAEARIRQDGVWLKPGDEFECTAADADDLKAMKMARPVDDRPRRQYRRRDMTAQ